MTTNYCRCIQKRLSVSRIRIHLHNQNSYYTNLSNPVFSILTKQKSRSLNDSRLAERGGFEPPRRCYRPTGIRSQTLQPLGYLSTANCILTQPLLRIQEDLRRFTIVRLLRFRTQPRSSTSRMAEPASSVALLEMNRYDGSQPFSMSSPAYRYPCPTCSLFA